MIRQDMIRAIDDRKQPWDMIIIGGGATGLGAAVDAASRGYDVVLFEQADFSKGTSSRSTKLVHGGVRYLQQGNVSLVLEALRERGLLLRNAPHLVSDQAFIVPSYEWWESPFYGVGLKVYDMLAGKYGFGKSRHLSKKDVIDQIPSISQDGLRGGTLYYDGQFDDSRLAVNLAQTAYSQGATLLNYAGVVGLQKNADGEINGVRFRDHETGEEHEVAGKVVINATGPFADGVRKMDHSDAKPIISPSQGVHIVLDKSFIPGDTAIMVPHTDDGRVMFAIPWHDVAVIGTTDEGVDTCDLEPKPMDKEITFILDNANKYLAKPATRDDIKAAFAGIRPLVKADGTSSTSSLSRDHTILIDPDSALVTIAGGKWTTYRKMSEDVVDQSAALAGLESRRCVTKELPIRGYHRHSERFGRLKHYGADAVHIRGLIEGDSAMGEPVHPSVKLTRAEVAWGCREEMARTVDDMLARRSRELLFDASAAIEASDAVAEAMAAELGKDANWASEQAASFKELAAAYTVQAG